MIITNAIPLEELKIVFMILCQLVAMKIHGLVEWLLSEVIFFEPGGYCPWGRKESDMT